MIQLGNDKIKLIKTQLCDFSGFVPNAFVLNPTYQSNIKDIKHIHDNWEIMVSCSKNNNTDTKEDIMDRKDTDIFKEWYYNEFGSFKNIYNNIKDSEYNYIDIFVEIDNNDIKNWGLKLAKLKVFKKKLNEIKRKYYNFEKILIKINKPQCHKRLISNGIYYKDIYNDRIESIDDLLKIITKYKDAKIIFQEMNTNNEGNIQNQFITYQ